MRFLRPLAAACFAMAAAVLPLRADQGSACMPTTGTVSGLAFAQAVNLGLAAIISSNSGATAPANGCAGVPVKGQWWLDTSASPNILKFNDGTSWLAVGAVDLTNHVWAPPIGGGTATLASANTVDLGSAAGSAITISGTTTIASFGSNAVAGTAKFLRFSGALTLTHHATSLILPAGADITTSAGDQAIAIALGGGNWSIWSYSRASGLPVANQAVPIGTVLDYVGFNLPDDRYAFAAGQCLDRDDFPLMAPALGKVQEATRVSGNATITGLGDTSMFGAGMQIEGVGIAPGSTIVSLTSSTLTLSQQASSNGTGDVTVYPGAPCTDSSGEIRLPDLRGRVAAGRDNMGGAAATRLTSAGSGVNALALGAAGGGETQTLTVAQMPSHAHPGSITGAAGAHSHTYSISTGGASYQAGSSASAFNSYSITSTAAEPAHTHTVTIAAQGGGAPHPVVQPTLTVNKIIRVK